MRLFLFILILSLSKVDYTYTQNLKINKVQLTNDILKKQITDFIKIRKKEYLKFTEIGYVIVKLDYFDNDAKNEELSLMYTIKDQYVSIKENSQFPLYYTKIEDKIVLLYIDNFEKNVKLSLKNKRKLLKKVNRTLGKRERITAFDSEEKKIIDDKYFYPNESFNIHGGIKLKVFANDSISIKSFY